MSNIIHYLDDFFTIGSPHTVECISNLTALRTAFDVLGVPLDVHKTVGPATSIIFLGVNLDSCNLQLSLLEEKLRDLKALIQSWVGRKVTTARDLKSLVGKLENACKVVCPGRSFPRRMIDLLWGVKSNRRLVRFKFVLSLGPAVVAPLSIRLEWHVSVGWKIPRVSPARCGGSL